MANLRGASRAGGPPTFCDIYNKSLQRSIRERYPPNVFFGSATDMYVCVYMYVCMYVCTYVCMYVCVYVYKYVYVYVYVYVCMYVGR